MSKQKTDLTDFELLQLAATLSASMISGEGGYTPKSAASLMIECAAEIENQILYYQEQQEAAEAKRRKEVMERRFRAMSS